jgi:hypothetical protein
VRGTDNDDRNVSTDLDNQVTNESQQKEAADLDAQDMADDNTTAEPEAKRNMEEERRFFNMYEASANTHGQPQRQ